MNYYRLCLLLQAIFVNLALLASENQYKFAKCGNIGVMSGGTILVLELKGNSATSVLFSSIHIFIVEQIHEIKLVTISCEIQDNNSVSCTFPNVRNSNLEVESLPSCIENYTVRYCHRVEVDGREIYPIDPSQTEIKLRKDPVFMSARQLQSTKTGEVEILIEGISVNLWSDCNARQYRPIGYKISVGNLDCRLNYWAIDNNSSKIRCLTDDWPSKEDYLTIYLGSRCIELNIGDEDEGNSLIAVYIIVPFFVIVVVVVITVYFACYLSSRTLKNLEECEEEPTHVRIEPEPTDPGVPISVTHKTSYEAE